MGNARLGTSQNSTVWTPTTLTGCHHTGYRQWSHVQWKMINMEHSAVRYIYCTDHYYNGIVSYSDGSKNLIYR